MEKNTTIFQVLPIPLSGPQIIIPKPWSIAQKIIDSRYSNSEIIADRIKDADLVIIDELDKIMMKDGNSNVRNQLENFLRELLPNKKSVLIGTNYTEEEVEETFNIISLIRRYIKIMSMDGEDFSNELSDKWDERLESGKFNFREKTLLSESKVFSKIG